MSRFLPASLRSRLALLALVPIVPALLLSLYTFAEQRHFAVNEGKAQALRLARQAATEQEQLLTGTRDLLIVVARQARASGLATDACGTAMSSFMSPFFINLGVATLRGDVVCSAALLRRSARIADNTSSVPCRRATSSSASMRRSMLPAARPFLRRSPCWTGAGG